mgnify:CR=1 FL=1|tara:strand:- start:272 stop:616 length:345 start_codon:yes stop_codon:yes gene_type:complete
MNNPKRRFRPRQQKNGFKRRSNTGHGQVNNFSNNNGKIFSRNGSMNNPFAVEKAIQKYQQLAKDALSSGDPILHENYLQHADHFSRRLYELNLRNKPDNKIQEKNEIDKQQNES